MNTIDEGNILFAWITSNEPVCIEGWSKFSVPIWSPWESNLTRRRSGCQLGLFSINFDFRNVIFQSMVFPSRLGEVQMKICKGLLQAPFPLPLVASPLARASSRDLFHSPKQESLLAGIVINAHKSRTRKETRAIERGKESVQSWKQGSTYKKEGPGPNTGSNPGAANVKFRKISVRKTIWDLEF